LVYDLNRPTQHRHRKGTYKDDKLDGPWVYYWENGRIYSKGNYKDGKKDGPWVHYLKNGTKRFTTHVYGMDEGTGTYKNGKKVK